MDPPGQGNRAYSQIRRRELCSQSGATKPKINTASLTARIEELTRAASVYGLTVTIFNDARTVYSRAFGFANLPARQPLHLDTEYYGASLSKAVFAVLVMKLVEQGVIDLDTAASEVRE